MDKLYEDAVNTDDDLDGTSMIRVFFHVDLEDVDEENIQQVYYSNAWYDITDSEGEVIWTTEDDPQTADVYTYELIVNKYDVETDEPLDATFGIFKDADATNAVTRNESDYIATTDENGRRHLSALPQHLSERAGSTGCL